MQVADPPGRYSLALRPKDKGASAGLYEIEVVELRRASEADLALQGARGANANLTSLYQSGDFKGAIAVAKRLLEIRKRALGPEHQEVADILNNLGVLHQAAGDFTEAERFYKDALALKEKILGVTHPSVAKTLFNLADFYRVRGDFEESERRYRRALTIFEHTPGLDRLDVAKANSAIASLYWSLGEYDKAEPLFRHSLTMREETLGENNAEVALARVRLAVLHHTLGDYAKAESLYQRALPVLETTLGPRHKEYLGVLINLGEIRRTDKDYNKAEALYRRVLDTLEESLGAEHPDVATALNNLAAVYLSSGDIAKAEPLLQRALTIRENKFGREHSAVASSLVGFGQLLRAKGDYDHALVALDRALAIRTKRFGPKNLGVAQILSALAMTYAAQGNVPQAIAFQARSSAITEHNLALNTATGSERRKLIYLAPLAGESNQIVSYHLNYARNNPQARDLAMTTILRRKGRVLEAMSDSIGALRRRARPQDQALFARLEAAQAKLASLVREESQDDAPESHLVDIKNAEEQVEQLEAEISRNSIEFRTQSLPVTIASVQAAIPADAVLLEFIAYEPFNAKYRKLDEALGPLRYAAYVLQRRGNVKWVDIGPASVINDAVMAFRAALRNPGAGRIGQVARNLDDRVMRRVRSLLGSKRRIFLSPDGALNLIPFGALSDERNQYLVTRYTFTYLTSGRDLLRLRAQPASKRRPIVIANPSFDSVAVPADGQGAPESRSSGVSRRATDYQEKFTPLSGTADEGTDVGSLLRVTPLTGAQATESVVKSAMSPSVLHLATHGFFLPPHQPRPRDYTFLNTSNQLTAGLGESPLLRSGIALAGANRLQGGEGEDGIITALEVSGLNLWGTQLVVLSACETGLGDVRLGEGVYGLRRSLVLAGSKSQLMSLWKVNDEVTRDFMSSYYRQLLSGRGKGQALRNIQLDMLKSKGKRDDRSHPYFWASFILSGDWGRLVVREHKKPRG